jgi:hypothetical protein
VQFLELGRTRNDVSSDSTTFDTGGNATHIGTNQPGRYPLHTHYLIGPRTIPANGYQFTLIGNVLDGGPDEHNLRWGLNIHASHYGLIQDNIVYNTAGAGIVTQDGSEAFNVFDHNFVVKTHGQGRGYKSASGGDAFWCHGVKNYLRNNVAADAEEDGYTLFMQISGSSEVPFASPLQIPAFQGADPSLTAEGITVHPNAIPILEFTNNEVYGPGERGLNIWDLALDIGTNDNGSSESVVRDFKVWHLHYNVGHAVFAYNAHWLTVEGLVVRGDTRNLNPQKALKFQVPRGAGFINTRRAQGNIIRNADIQGYLTGIDVPDNLGGMDNQPGSLTVEDSYILAHVGMEIRIPLETRKSTDRQVIVRNVLFEPLPVVSAVDGPFTAIFMHNTESTNTKYTYLRHDEVLVYDYNQIPRNDFQVFYLEQHPNTVLPAHEAPVPGITNKQAWTQYGIAIGGEVAPCLNTTSHPEIHGFTCPQ